MIVTEQEAARLACPFARNFGDKDATPYTCQGAACMAWDWQDDEYIFPGSHCQTLGIEYPEGVKPVYAYQNGETNEQLEARKAAFAKQYPDFNWFRVNDERMLAAGWEMHPMYEKDKFTGGTQTLHRWRRLHPARKGQCGRTAIISVERD